MLIAEAKKQGKPYGLYFEDISSGFAVTTRRSPQAFQVIPLVVYRVYVDGRPDELVRGVSIVGTPQAALNSILATGDKQDVFNGICGAESGSIPVSAVAPAMLVSEIETQRQAAGHGPSAHSPAARRIRQPIQTEERSKLMNMLLTRLQIETLFRRIFAACVLFATSSVTYIAAPQDPPKDDPVLRAMQAELDREQAQLLLPGMQRPYFIEYRLDDVASYEAVANYGALVREESGHQRVVRVTVRIGSYATDSSSSRGDGIGRARPHRQQSRGHSLLPLDRNRRGLQERPARLLHQAGRAEALRDAAHREGFCPGQAGRAHRPAGLARHRPRGVEAPHRGSQRPLRLRPRGPRLRRQRAVFHRQRARPGGESLPGQHRRDRGAPGIHGLQPPTSASAARRPTAWNSPARTAPSA